MPLKRRALFSTERQSLSKMKIMLHIMLLDVETAVAATQ
jgi:hypothetical protein